MVFFNILKNLIVGLLLFVFSKFKLIYNFLWFVLVVFLINNSVKNCLWFGNVVKWFFRNFVDGML